MGLFNLGKKDEYGRQRRVEHRGRHLRASRTGGVALRAQAKAAGVNVTANTSTGFRVSGTPMTNTQVALQNGRFVLRGRYGDGPTKLNVSKTGATVSTRNALGSFNWIKPNRSSAKVAGVQVHGRNAAFLQMIYMLFVGLAMAVQVLIQALVVLFRLGVLLGGIVYRLALATPYAVAVTKRRFRNWRLARRVSQGMEGLEPPTSAWTQEALIAGTALVLVAWGRERDPDEVAQAMQERVASNAETWPVLASATEDLAAVAARLQEVQDNDDEQRREAPPMVMAALAQRMTEKAPEHTVSETILQADELALEDGDRTQRQEALIEIYADFAGIRFQEPEEVASATNATQSQPESAGGNRGPAPAAHDAYVALNTATEQELQNIPHLGSERARELITMRPITDLNQLTAINGIGATRLDDIRDYGVTLD
ncbi:helix-hairpin-helix domain-containing protein [Salicola sp. Rm-C-2C1-2]|uniref:ComEA family DNA-binding protein n=1 Tax=Salicola sp. Rm-C-2C1-2 TaxID=3141321 RepID=UPI0032E46ACC